MSAANPTLKLGPVPRRPSFCRCRVDELVYLRFELGRRVVQQVTPQGGAGAGPGRERGGGGFNRRDRVVEAPSGSDRDDFAGHGVAAFEGLPKGSVLVLPADG